MGFCHLVVSFFLLSSSLCNYVAGVFVRNTCKATEREALLQLKRSSMDYHGVFSSWINSDCCRNWTGVSCDRHSGHVVELRVDLGGGGLVPPQIGNLSHLESLSLSGFRIEGVWIARLTSLKQLRLKGTYLGRARDFIPNLNTLPFISEINISGGSVLIPRSLQHVNFTHLSRLTLDRSSLNMSMPYWLFNVTTLTYLSMRNSNVTGSIPSSIGNLYNLEMLDLSYNGLSGVIPDTLGDLHHLSALSLRRNKLTGNVPSSLGNLASLTRLILSHNRLNGSMPAFVACLTNMEELYLEHNNLQGLLTESSFDSLRRLSKLDLAGNPLEIRFASDWNPPFQLDKLDLASCKVGPSFPGWIQTQSQLTYLNLSNTDVSGILPAWLWDLPRIQNMDLSGNNLSGTFPSKLLDKMPFLYTLFLVNNRIEGPLPQFKNASNLRMLLLSNNSFSGRIPVSYCQLKGLDVLDLSANQLSGRIPRCLQKLENLSVLNLGNNKLDGSTEGIFSSSGNLKMVSLNGNYFSGDFPLSLRMCSGLKVLNIGQNNFSGNLPTWIATSFPLLSALIVSSNKLYGEIPQELQLLKKLRILDLSDNKFSGSIPRGLGNFSAMKDPSTIDESFFEYDWGLTYTVNIEGHICTYSAVIIIKGQRYEYSRLLSLLVLVDLSSNELAGEIPRELSDLLELRSLNLSRNHLIGNIPNNMGTLKKVESLDLSFNNLHGEIPESMLGMNSLVALNLSYNNLTGRIPSGSQFSTFDSSSYIGNAGLCGSPLPILCDDGENSDKVHDDMHGDQNGAVFLYTSMIFGFVFGFWALYGILWFKRRWCQAYFGVIDNMLEKIYDQAIKRNCSRSQGLVTPLGNESEPGI